MDCVSFDLANGILGFCPEDDGSVSITAKDGDYEEIIVNLPADVWLGLVDAMNPLEV